MSNSCIDFPVSSSSSSILANNGLSIDPITNNIVWGNDVGDITNPAALLSDRFIEFGSFGVTYSDVPNFRTLLINPTVLMFDDSLSVMQTSVQAGTINIYTNDGAASISVLPGFPATIELMTTAGNEPRINLTDSFLVGITLKSSPALGMFDISEYGVPNSRKFLINSITNIYQFGDIDSIATGINLTLDGGTGIATIGETNNRALFIDFGNRIYQLGDVDSVFDGSIFTIDNVNQVFQMSSDTGIVFIADITGQTYSFGATSGFGNQTSINIDDIITERRLNVFALNGIKITGDTVLLHTGTALTDGAASATGTLTNAPTAGNPTKWISIDDNGTIRYIPTWL